MDESPKNRFNKLIDVSHTNELIRTLCAQSLYGWPNDNAEIRAYKDGFCAGFCAAKKEYLAAITELARQNDELLRALEYSINQVPELASVPGISEAIASVKGGE